MKARLSLLFLLLAFRVVALCASPDAGFHLPDHIKSLKLHYRSVNELIVLPIIVNDSVHLNVVLDTGCRNLVLFGNKYARYVSIQPNRNVKFSGLGNGKPVEGKLSLNNRVAINDIEGLNIPIVVIPNRNIFKTSDRIDGIIGYEIFLKFEVEIIPKQHVIIFRSAERSTSRNDAHSFPLTVEDTRPVLSCSVYLDGAPVVNSLMIDTGSTLGLLIKQSAAHKSKHKTTIVGKGLNGNIEGRKETADMKIESLSLHAIEASFIYHAWETNASIGMGILKDYNIIINYSKGFASIRHA